MAAHSHDDHHMTGQKPVAFTVPFILAAVTLLILFMFLSLCDPKPHHAGNHEMHGASGTEHHDAKAEGTHETHATEAPAAEAPEAANSSEPEAHH